MKLNSFLISPPAAFCRRAFRNRMTGQIGSCILSESLEGDSAIPIGFRAFLEIEKPDAALIKACREIPGSNIGDCVRRMNCMLGGTRYA